MVCVFLLLIYINIFILHNFVYSDNGKKTLNADEATQVTCHDIYWVYFYLSQRIA